VLKELGELVYAGGRQTGPALEMLVVKEVAQSYLTQLWNRHEEKNEEHSYIHLLSRWFTYIVLAIAASAAIYWRIYDPARIAGAVTAVLIVACPCALLLSSTFTNGNILRILGHNGLYLRNARVIENIAATTHIVFDKTGTLTMPGDDAVTYEGSPLTLAQQEGIALLAAQSTHPLSKALTRHLGMAEHLAIAGFRESPGKGVEGWIEGQKLTIGSRLFVTGLPSAGLETRVYIAWNNVPMGYFRFSNHYRDGIPGLVQTLGRRFRLSLLSGDNDRERSRLQAFMGRSARIFFNRTPEKKAAYICQLQQQGEKVMMIGDGLNDAGALRQSDTGIALAEDHHSFTPASHAILEASRLQCLPQFVRFCRMAGRIILASFILSILYNVIGLSFAVRGHLSPLIAAILMPSSSLSILILTYSSVNWAAKYLGFNLSAPAEKDHASR
jgi:Cu+-exporting ATPase